MKEVMGKMVLSTPICNGLINNASWLRRRKNVYKYSDLDAKVKRDASLKKMKAQYLSAKAQRIYEIFDNLDKSMVWFCSDAEITYSLLKLCPKYTSCAILPDKNNESLVTISDITMSDITMNDITMADTHG